MVPGEHFAACELGGGGRLVCLFVSFCLSLYSYSSLKPKGFMEAPVQARTISPGPPGSGGRRADRVFPGAAPYSGGTSLLGGHHTLSHGSRHNNILSQPRGTNLSIQILAFPHTSHVYTREYILIHKHARLKPDLRNVPV